MLPARYAIFVCEKTGFSIHSGHKVAAAFVSDFGWGSFGCGRGDAATELLCKWWRRWGSAEEDELRDLEVVE